MQTRFPVAMKATAVLLFVLLACASAFAADKTNAFEKEILAFEARDKTNPPPKNAILFVGSSSIRMWKTLAQDLPQYPVINRGFGGSQIADSIHFADRIVIPYEPRLIVMYAGGNDINAKKKPDVIARDFKAFVAKVREKLPNTHIAYISIAGNPARWAQVEQVKEANRLIREFTATQPRMSFIDVFPHMMGDDGMPKPDIFLPDRLHMNEKGYAIWKRVVGEHLKSLEQRRGE
jgi:lysophospholipase L1-like esterase